MNEESKKLFAEFVEMYADSKVIAIRLHIEWLIYEILKVERDRAELSARWLTGAEIMKKVGC